MEELYGSYLLCRLRLVLVVSFPCVVLVLAHAADCTVHSDCVLNYPQVGEESSLKTFLIDVKWGDSYPDDLPHVSLDAFYNKLLYVIFTALSVAVFISTDTILVFLNTRISSFFMFLIS